MVSGSFERNTFLRRVLDHMSSQHEGTHQLTLICSAARPKMGRWATWGDPQSQNQVGSLPLK